MGQTSNLKKFTKFAEGCCRQWCPQRKNRSTDRQNENISLKSTTIPVAGQKISWNDQYRKAVDPPEDPLMKSRGFCILQIPRFSILRYCSHFFFVVILWSKNALLFGYTSLFTHLGRSLVFSRRSCSTTISISKHNWNLKNATFRKRWNTHWNMYFLRKTKVGMGRKMFTLMSLNVHFALSHPETFLSCSEEIGYRRQYL